MGRLSPFFAPKLASNFDSEKNTILASIWEPSGSRFGAILGHFSVPESVKKRAGFRGRFRARFWPPRDPPQPQKLLFYLKKTNVFEDRPFGDGAPPRSILELKMSPSWASKFRKNAFENEVKENVQTCMKIGRQHGTKTSPKQVKKRQVFQRRGALGALWRALGAPRASRGRPGGANNPIWHPKWPRGPPKGEKL